MSASAEYGPIWDCIQLWEIASGRAPVGEVVDGAVVVGVPQGGYIGAHVGCVGVVALDVTACHLLRQREQWPAKSDSTVLVGRLLSVSRSVSSGRAATAAAAAASWHGTARRCSHWNDDPAVECKSLI